MTTDPRHSDIERRLRAALDDRASTVEPSPDGLSRIEDRLLRSNPTPKRAVGVLAAAAAIVIAVVVGIHIGGDGGDVPVVTDDTTPTTDPADTTETTETTPTTGTTPTTSTTEAPALPVVSPYAVAWPAPDTENFDGPGEAARLYATNVLGFTNLEIASEFRAGDSRSGEIGVSDRVDGRETTILLREMDDGYWYVLGSVTADITVDAPSSGGIITSPFRTTGLALAFEGHVDVVVMVQADLTQVGAGYVTGSGVPPAGPFADDIAFTQPAADTPGILIYRTLSAEDGHVEQATSFPVRLSGGPD